MAVKVCISVDTIGYLKGGGHIWAYLNWALGLRELGCEVIWLEQLNTSTPLEKLRGLVAALRNLLSPFGIADSIALALRGIDLVLPPEELACLNIEKAAEADLLLNFRYDTPTEILRCFRKSVLVDIDPGLLQIWIHRKHIHVAEHDLYCTIGETVGKADALFPDCSINWIYTAPCVALESWPVCLAPIESPFSTISHWHADEWLETENEFIQNDKRSGFYPYLELPKHTKVPLELALSLGEEEVNERKGLEALGWRVVDSYSVASTPESYRSYIQNSRGEFSCAKPSCLLLSNAWVSDRTLCYLASGKPAVVQYTGYSDFLPEFAGLFRFQTLDDAAICLEEAVCNYEKHCKLARELAVEYFDSKKVINRLLTIAF